MDISVVIPNYNGERILQKNLPKVLKELEEYEQGKVELIVVDDCSTDNSAQIIKNFSKIKLYTNSRNLGFSSTVNKGVVHAQSDLIMLLNSDVYPDKGFLETLIAHFKDKEIFAVGCMDKSVEGKNVVLRGRGIGSWRRGFLVHKKGEVSSSDTLWVGGGSGMFRKSIWDKLGGLNTLFNPFYWEDIDISYRALKTGYKLAFESKSTVWHEHDKGAIKSKYNSFDIKTIAYKNQFIFVWINLTDLNLLISHFLWLPYHVFKAILNRDLAFYLGFLSALLNLPKILKSRFFNKKMFVKKDLEITKNYSQ